MITDCIVRAYLLIPVPVRRFVCASLLRRPRSTAHAAFGGWANFRGAWVDWADK